jgi:ribose 5-phosphate isomerase B
MRIGIAADHAGFELKNYIVEKLKSAKNEVMDFGAFELVLNDDYPDYIVPLSNAVAKYEVRRGIAICGSGVGASIAANKVAGVRAALITDPFSAHQGVEDDDMNVMCLGGWVVGKALAWDLVQIFLKARFKAQGRYMERLTKISELENHRGKN